MRRWDYERSDLVGVAITTGGAILRVCAFGLGLSLAATLAFGCGVLRRPEASGAVGGIETKADRAKWRSSLGWPDECEEAFEVTYAAGGAGLEAYELGNGGTLVVVHCAAGAYQGSYRYYLIEGQELDPDRAVSLTLTAYESADGHSIQPVPTAELWGEPTVVSQAGDLIILQLGRQTSDCGAWARYSIAAGVVELREVWARYPCPPEVGEPAEPGSQTPPHGWRRIDRN